MKKNNCQCKKKNGTRCTLPRSTIKGLDPRYCTRWHQKCLNVDVHTEQHLEKPKNVENLSQVDRKIHSQIKQPIENQHKELQAHEKQFREKTAVEVPIIDAFGKFRWILGNEPEWDKLVIKPNDIFIPIIGRITIRIPSIKSNLMDEHGSFYNPIRFMGPVTFKQFTDGINTAVNKELKELGSDDLTIIFGPLNIQNELYKVRDNVYDFN